MATTWLFVPASRPDRFDKALSSTADEVILDLEDAVHPDEKEQARRQAAIWLNHEGPAWVRVNGSTTPWFDADLVALLGAPGLRGIVLPKTETPADLAAVHAMLDVPVVALIETARGVRRAFDIAECGLVQQLAFGSIDYALDLWCDESDDALLLGRTTLVLAARAAGLPAPIDGVTASIAEPGLVERAARRARGLGFGGKLIIHPNQVLPVLRGMAPSDAEVAWAVRIQEESVRGAAAVDGYLVDLPAIRRAEAILKRTDDLDIPRF